MGRAFVLDGSVEAVAAGAAAGRVRVVDREALLLDRVDEVDDSAGEGAFDATSLRGKAVAGVAGLAQAAGVPCVVLAGRVEVGRRDAAAAGVEEAYAVSEVVGSPAAALDAGPAGLAATAARAARAWSRGRP